MSSPSYKSRFTYDTIRSRDSATFTGSYQTLGSALTHEARIVKVVNNSNVTATISIDGVNDHDILPMGSFVLYDCSSDRENSNIFEIPEGTQFYVKGIAGAGLVYLTVIYAS